MKNQQCSNCYHGRITESLKGLASKNSFKTENLSIRYCLDSRNYVSVGFHCKNYKSDDKATI